VDVPHLVQMQEKFGSRGWNIVGVTIEEAATIDGFLKKDEWKHINYYIGVTPRNSIQPYGIRGWPTCYLIGPDGNIVSKTRTFTEAQIEEMVSTLAPTKVDREVARELRRASASFDKGEYGPALREAEKFLGEDAAEKFEEDVRTDAAYIKSLVERQVEANTKRLNDAVEAKEWLEVQKMLPTIKKNFKGLPLEDRVKEVETTLRSREVRADIALLTQVDRFATEWNASASNERQRATIKARIEAFIKANEGTKAAEKAANIIK
jgi:hypothetical protein